MKCEIFTGFPPKGVTKNANEKTDVFVSLKAEKANTWNILNMRKDAANLSTSEQYKYNTAAAA